MHSKKCRLSLSVKLVLDILAVGAMLPMVVCPQPVTEAAANFRK